MTVSVATAEDLAKILCWLEYEYIESGTEGFWCNRRLIAQSLDRSELYVVKYDGQAVAFQTGIILME